MMELPFLSEHQDNKSCECENYAEHGGVEAVAFYLADEGDGEDFVAHGGEEVGVGC